MEVSLRVFVLFFGKGESVAQNRIVLAVSGGIAAYKIPELVRALRKEGHEVRCVLTASAAEFVSPLVLQTLSGHAVRTNLFDPEEEGSIDHIALADWAEVVVVAPATANLLAKLTYGIADDLVTTLVLATRAKLLVAPAMNVNMWDSCPTQENVDCLRARGVQFVGPEVGFLACGWQGEGRMAEVAMIAEAIERALAPQSLAGEVVLVTAGGTQEPIDAVRVIANRSSGKMGYAIAAEAARRGAEVHLVSGATALPTPIGVERTLVRTALEMRDAVQKHFLRASIVIQAAAVADFRPETVCERKIKKEELPDEEGLQIRLVRNPDILAEICRQNRAENLADATTERSTQMNVGSNAERTAAQRFIVGFAAESHDVVAAARRKLERKGCDLIVANDISRQDAGFEVDQNAVVLVRADGNAEEWPLLSKREVAMRLWDSIEKMKGAKR